jgi:O-antigen/teichoic acid export membrane protein
LSFGISNILNHALHAASRFKEILLCNGIGLIAGTWLATQFMPQYNVFGAALAWSAGLFMAMISYLLLYLYHHIKFYNTQKLSVMVALSLIVFVSSMMVFRQSNSFADWHFIQRFCVSLSISLSLTVALNFIVHKLMHGIKPRNS